MDPLKMATIDELADELASRANVGVYLMIVGDKAMTGMLEKQIDALKRTEHDQIHYTSMIVKMNDMSDVAKIAMMKAIQEGAAQIMRATDEEG